MKTCNDNTNGFSFVLYAMLVAFVLANNLETNEQAILGAFLSDVGTNLLSISAYNKYIRNLCPDDDSTDINPAILPLI